MKIIQIVKTLAKDHHHPEFIERYHIYYNNGDSLTLDYSELTDTMLKFIATHEEKEGDTITYEDTGFICKDVYYG